MLLLLPTGLASSLPWPGLASVARGGSNCQNSMLLAPHRRARGRDLIPLPSLSLQAVLRAPVPIESFWAQSQWPHLTCLTGHCGLGPCIWSVGILLTPLGSAALMPMPWLSVPPSPGRPGQDKRGTQLGACVLCGARQAQVLREEPLSLILF